MFLASCKSTDRFSAHARRYSTGFYFEKHESPAQPKIVHKKSFRQEDRTKPVLTSSGEIIASNSTNHSTNTREKVSDRKKKKWSFNEVQIKHHNSEKAEPSKKKHSLSLNEIRRSERKAPGQMGVGSYILAGFLYAVGSILLWLGFYMFLAGLGGNPEFMALGVILFLIGLAMIGATTMVAFS